MRARTAQAAVQAAAPPNAAELAAQLDALAAEATSPLDELSEPARGIHPAFLAEDGLRPALNGLARRSPVPAEPPRVRRACLAATGPSPRQGAHNSSSQA